MLFEHTMESGPLVPQAIVSVPDPKPTPAWIAFSIARGEGSFPRIILEAIYAPDEVWGRDYTG